MERVKELGQEAVAITDHGVMYGVIDFYKAAKAAGIQPIIGCEVYVAPRTMADRVHGLTMSPTTWCCCAKTWRATPTCLPWCQKASSMAFYGKPRVDLQLLRQHAKGLIALFGLPGRGHSPAADGR